MYVVFLFVFFPPFFLPEISAKNSPFDHDKAKHTHIHILYNKQL